MRIFQWIASHPVEILILAFILPAYVMGPVEDLIRQRRHEGPAGRV